MLSRIRARRAPLSIPVHLGRTDVTTIAAAVRQHLATGATRITIEIVGFDYFNGRDLDALTQLAELGAGRVDVIGLDGYAAIAVETEPEPTLDVRTWSERATAVLSSVAVITCVLDGHVLDDLEFEAAVGAAGRSGR